MLFTEVQSRVSSVHDRIHTALVTLHYPTVTDRSE